VDGRRLELPTSALRTGAASAAKVVSGEHLSPRLLGMCPVRELRKIAGFCSVARRARCVVPEAISGQGPGAKSGWHLWNRGAVPP
jgi:hypothetical protein